MRPSTHHAFSGLETNSGPLSARNEAGAPQIAVSSNLATSPIDAILPVPVSLSKLSDHFFRTALIPALTLHPRLLLASWTAKVSILNFGNTEFACDAESGEISQEQSF
jgi:hypothetical protein